VKELRKLLSRYPTISKIMPKKTWFFFIFDS
jgi:hypothetical protein